jgi:uncharacterized protein (TIGR02145 family)
MAKYFLRHLVVDIFATYYKLKNHNMMLKILPLLMLPCLGMAQINSKVEMPMGENTTSEKQPLEIKRNATYNLEEIKVRWKKAALENCIGAPCVITPPAPSFTCGTSTISDIDNNSYETVLIGTQCWTKQNLKVTKYNDGSNILEINGTSTWDFTIVTGARTVYSDLSANLSTYGYLYNWYAATDSRKLCPAGWHVPTDGEWTTLIKFIDPMATDPNPGFTQSSEGGKMKSMGITLWTSTNAGTNNSSGFTAFPGGRRNAPSVGGVGSFTGIGSRAFFWSATTTSLAPSSALCRSLYTYNDVDKESESKSQGSSVRCLRD